MIVGRAMQAAALLLPLELACRDDVFNCTRDGDCRDDARAGVCTDLGYCAFEDASCPTGLEYGALAPSSVAGSCVPGGVGGSTGQPSEGSSSSTGIHGSETLAGSESESESSGGGPACRPSEPCEPADPCAAAGLCDGAGTCMPITFVVCAEPPNDCYAPEGQCTAGTCEYTPRVRGEACADTDACTEGDSCDGAGSCVPGEICPSDNPCTTSSCIDGACAVEAVDDGSSCGAAASARCCGGTCVDISSDTAHCGGCNTQCSEGLECESISATASCEIAPEATSGRCRCEGLTSQCPLGQLCRTFDPYVDRCVPPATENCADSRFSQNSCPSWCGYD
ncbi:MAG: hypothetical protein IAG13_26460 [Deltaproteobacteria bacterium]|nr:hypothetical protein [Nannocystaceae bacterium]